MHTVVAGKFGEDLNLAILAMIAKLKDHQLQATLYTVQYQGQGSPNQNSPIGPLRSIAKFNVHQILYGSLSVVT